MRPAILLVLSCLLAFRGEAHDARNALYAITPQLGEADGIKFRITSEPLPGGAARFRVVMSEDQAKFNQHPITELGFLKDTRSARSIYSARNLPATRQGHALICVFIADKKSLQDPNFCFLFTGLERSFLDTIRFTFSADYVFARLKDFAPQPRR